MELPPPANQEERVKYKRLSNSDRKAAYHMLLAMAEDGELARGSVSSVAALFSVNKSSISRLWRTVRQKSLSNQNLAPGEEAEDIYASDAPKRRKGKYIHDRQAIKEAVKALPSARRKRYRWLAAALDLPVSTIHYLTKSQCLFRKCRSALKPTLTLENRLVRVDHCLSKIDRTTINNNNQPQYSNMFDEIHVDEKWFFLCRDGESYILVADEEDPPERFVKHKSHITKVMFLCAQARPRMVRVGTREDNQRMWDGKIGIWPIGDWKAAQRASVNRPAGTMEFHGRSVDRDTYREYLVNKVIPAIATKWPRHEWNDPSFTIYIQQDGATSHITPWDAAIDNKLVELGMQAGKVELQTQPANSPDLNLNDLGFFNSLQANYYMQCPRNAMELIEMVQETYDDYPSNKINRIWLTLQCCMNEILKIAGCNQYKIPHMGKEALEKAGRLPVTLEVCPEAEGLY